MAKVAIIAAKRSPIGSFGGAFKNLSAIELGKQVLMQIISENGLDPHLVDEVIIGNVIGTGLGQNVARQISVNAGIPYSTPAWSVNKVCGSGMKAIVLAANSIANGNAKVVVAGGVENMSQVPYILPEFRWGGKLGNKTIVDGIVFDGLTDIFNKYHMGITAENLADKYNITRKEMDEFAVQSHNKAQMAQESGRFSDEIVPIKIPQRKGADLNVLNDEHIKKDCSVASISQLRPAFKKEGTVTAANSSGINDGSAVLLMMSEDKAQELSLKPIAFFVDSATAGVDPAIMGIGPVYAIQKLLKQTGLTLNEIGLFELNEAFAVQALAVFKGLEQEQIGILPPDHVNVNGGAIALGHPIGASGARIIVTLIHEMIRKDLDKGLASLCIGGGMGMASLVCR